MNIIKGYPVQSGYMGWIKNEWMLFATEQDYYDYIREESE